MCIPDSITPCAEPCSLMELAFCCSKIKYERDQLTWIVYTDEGRLYMNPITNCKFIKYGGLPTIATPTSEMQ